MPAYLRKLIFSFLFSLNLFCVQAQESRLIIGAVKDSATNATLSDAIVICKIDGKNYYSISDSAGRFSLTYWINDSLISNEILLVTKLIGFKEKEQKLYVSENISQLPTILLQSKSIYLSEVIVQNKPIVKKGDTTVFTVSAFSNKLDANLEDALKKMPGMDVDESGNIKYNNKPIENIMIEGDVLSKNYKLISKNITPDMVDKVEIIDKYNSNPALKNLVNTQKQTMNLVLKNPKKLKTFGTLTLGGGIKNRFKASGSLFAFNNRIKTMSLLNTNNIGVSPYSDYSVSQEYSRTTDYEFTPSILPSYIIENILFTQSVFGNNSNSLFNNSKLVVFNSSITLNKNTSLKLFTDAYSDKINQYQQTINQNNLYPQLSYIEKFEKRFLPQIFNNNAELKKQTKKSQILVMASYTGKKYGEQNEVLSSINFNTSLKSNYKRMATGIYYTYRIDSLSAFEVSYQNIFDKKNQKLSINQNEYRLLDSAYLTNFQSQQTYNDISTHIAELKYLYKKRRTNQISLKGILINSYFNANLNIKDNGGIEFKVPAYLDTTTIKNNNLLLNYNTGYSFNKFSVIADLGFLLNSYTGKSGDQANRNQNKLYVLPKISFSVTLDNHQKISTNIGWDVENPALTNTYLNTLLISYRTIKRNNAIGLPIDNLKYGLNYSYTNLNAATSLLLSYYHSTQMQSEIRNFTYTNSFDYVNTRFENAKLKIDNIYFKYDKYFYPLKTAIGIKHSLVWFSNPTEVAGSVTSSKFFSYTANLSVRPAIQKNINFNVGIDYRFNKDLKSTKNTFQINPFSDVMFSVGKKLSFGGRYNYFNSNYSEKQRSYVFANIYAWYTIKAKKLDAKFSVFNLLNTNATITGTATTALTRSVTTQLLPRYALVEFVYKF